MKNVIKLAVLLIVLVIFTFSQNPTISKACEFSVEKGGKVYEWIKETTMKSENQNISKFGETI